MIRDISLTVLAVAALAGPLSLSARAQTGAAAGKGAPPRSAPPPPSASSPPPASTQAAAPTQQGGAEGSNVKVERGAGGKKIYKITTEIRIEGKIQKPEAFYVLQKSSINYEWQELKQDFLPKIVDSVSQAPF